MQSLLFYPQLIIVMLSQHADILLVSKHFHAVCLSQQFFYDVLGCYVDNVNFITHTIKKILIVIDFRLFIGWLDGTFGR